MVNCSLIIVFHIYEISVLSQQTDQAQFNLTIWVNILRTAETDHEMAHHHPHHSADYHQLYA